MKETCLKDITTSLKGDHARTRICSPKSFKLEEKCEWSCFLHCTALTHYLIISSVVRHFFVVTRTLCQIQCWYIEVRMSATTHIKLFIILSANISTASTVRQIRKARQNETAAPKKVCKRGKKKKGPLVYLCALRYTIPKM